MGRYVSAARPGGAAPCAKPTWPRAEPTHPAVRPGPYRAMPDPGGLFRDVPVNQFIEATEFAPGYRRRDLKPVPLPK